MDDKKQNVFLIIAILLFGVYLGTNNPLNNTAENNNNIEMKVTNINNFEKIDINNSSISDLTSLRGIGREEAEKIVKNRPYKSKFDLVSKGVIDLRTLETNDKNIRAGD